MELQSESGWLPLEQTCYYCISGYRLPVRLVVKYQQGISQLHLDDIDPIPYHHPPLSFQGSLGSLQGIHHKWF